MDIQIRIVMNLFVFCTRALRTPESSSDIVKNDVDDRSHVQPVTQEIQRQSDSDSHTSA